MAIYRRNETGNLTEIKKDTTIADTVSIVQSYQEKENLEKSECVQDILYPKPKTATKIKD